MYVTHFPIKCERLGWVGKCRKREVVIRDWGGVEWLPPSGDGFPSMALGGNPSRHIGGEKTENPRLRLGGNLPQSGVLLCRQLIIRLLTIVPVAQSAHAGAWRFPRMLIRATAGFLAIR